MTHERTRRKAPTAVARERERKRDIDRWRSRDSLLQNERLIIEATYGPVLVLLPDVCLPRSLDRLLSSSMLSDPLSSRTLHTHGLGIPIR